MTWTARSKTMAGVLAGVVGTLVVVGLLPAAAHTSRVQSALADSSTATTSGITASGLGKVYGTPDTLLLSMGVQVNRPDVSAALAAANDKLDAVIASLKSHGVQSKDIQTSGLNVNPHYSGDQAQTITGYDVDHEISATLRNLKTAGGAVSAAIQAGGNAARVNGLSVALDSNDSLIAAARDRAFADAKAKAEQYANLAGRSLGKVVSISEATTTSQPIQYGAFPSAAGAGAAKDVAIEPGQQAVDVNVTVVWSFA
jgi:uncharacterized protein YggE